MLTHFKEPRIQLSINISTRTESTRMYHTYVIIYRLLTVVRHALCAYV